MARILPPPALPNAPGELRQDPLSGGWVAITVGRAARPEAFLGDVGTPRGPLGCPFCPGNEHMTPPEVWADRDPGTEPDKPGWHVRVVPNKFPAFAGPPAEARNNGGSGGLMEPEAPEGSGEPRRGAPVDQAPWGGASRSIGGLYRSVPTAGVHEVVIHNPDHEATLADLPPVAVARTMAAWRRRLAAHRDQAFGAVLVIVNQGRTAGASLEHPHSQVFGTAGRPDRVRAEVDRLAGDACAACATVAAERGGPRLVGANGDLLTLCPWASAAPFEALLLPAGHRPRFDEGGHDDTAMAASLRDLLRRFRGVAGDHAPYNLVLHSAPPGVDDFHWHLHLLPRLTTYGGFELGTGVIINVVDPDRAADALRSAANGS
ncbi:MAG TPA: galactose-1-phosphate uridylyltransferase [Actinomycetota bacterium]|jgi:UDPglucose--hexose-1-phosphate uridylyltransferase|nr:galactose-1-phosphate uridylyltransferase [Actinomycetota bacterium]